MSIHQYISKWNSEAGKYEGDYKDFAHGTTIYVGSRSTQIMSDVWGTELYAEYWDEETQSVKTAHLDTYEWGRSNKEYGLADATVDATEEVWTKVQEFYTAQFFNQFYREEERNARTITKGSIVRVYAGRTSKGAVGKVAVILERGYGAGWHVSVENKLGIATSDVMIEKEVNGKVYLNHRDMIWVWQRNCELAVVPTIDETPIHKRAAEAAVIKIKSLRQTQMRKAA